MRTASGPTVGFDLDMTLVDSREGIAATLVQVLGEVGVVVPPEQLWPLVGVPLESVLAGLAPEQDAGRLADRYRLLYPQVGIPGVRLLPGAAETVSAVRATGGRVLVVSAKAVQAVRAVLEHVGLDRGGLAPDEVCGGLFAQAKGARLRELGAALYVGDHPGDMQAARTAGVTGVGVLTGPHGEDALRAAGADVVLPDLRAFPGWFAGHLLRVG